MEWYQVLTIVGANLVYSFGLLDNQELISFILVGSLNPFNQKLRTSTEDFVLWKRR